MKKHFLFISAISLLTLSCSKDNRQYDATGTFEATEITVSSEQNGKLLHFSVEEGSPVAAGHEVGLVDTVQLALKARQIGATHESLAAQRPDVAKQIAATRQQLAKALQEQRRYEALVANNAANGKLLDDARNNVQVLRRQLEAAVSTLDNNTRSINGQMSAATIQRMQVIDQLEKCHITSPISGTVLEKYAEQGEFVTAGKPLFKVADIGRMYLRAYITSAQLADVKIGQRVKVMSDYGGGNGKTYDGVVTWIADKAEFTPKSIVTNDERADLVYAVKIAVKNDGGIKIGMYGEVMF